jgi:hypothetical protein
MALDMGGDQSLSRRAMKAELLDAETELRLAYAWRDERDEEALHRLVTAYMRLAISMAAKFKRYGAPMNDLIQEAGLGLMKAADKFDPDRGVRFLDLRGLVDQGLDPGLRDAQLVDGAHRLDLFAEVPVLQHAPRPGPAGA